MRSELARANTAVEKHPYVGSMRCSFTEGSGVIGSDRAPGCGELVLFREKVEPLTELFSELSADDTIPRPLLTRSDGRLCGGRAPSLIRGGGVKKGDSRSIRGVELALALKRLLSMRSPLLSTNGFPSFPRASTSFGGTRWQLASQ